MSVEHWMMFGTFAEQRHFVYPNVETYKGVVINANMVAHAAGGLAAFLLEKTNSLPYIIDPISHAFQHDPKFISDNRGEPKSSILSMALQYGAPLDRLVGSRPLLPEDLADKNVLRALVKSCLDFQNNLLANEMGKSNVIKYLTEEPLNSEEFLRPYALVAPYFYLTEATFEYWLPLLKDSAIIARELFPQNKVFTSVVISKGILVDDGFIQRLSDELLPIGLDGFLFWVDNLNEQEANGKELRGLLKLASALRNNGNKEVINLHGGYFSVVSSGFFAERLFSGVTHGPEFGEFRSVVPVGGGIPIARYYVPDLHSRVRYVDAATIFAKQNWLVDAPTFHRDVCDCAECRNVINGNSANFALFGESNVREVKRGTGIVRIAYPTSDAKLRCLRHYLQKKSVEYRFANTADSEQLINELESGIRKFRSALGLDGVSHLMLWRDILTEQSP